MKPKFKSERNLGIANARVYVTCSMNNTIVTITDHEGGVLASFSGGKAGFKGAHRSSPLAASNTAHKAVEYLKKHQIANIQLIVKGIGVGREYATSVFGESKLHVISIEDQTPIAYNGCKSRKVRK